MSCFSCSSPTRSSSLFPCSSFSPPQSSFLRSSSFPRSFVTSQYPANTMICRHSLCHLHLHLQQKQVVAAPQHRRHGLGWHERLDVRQRVGVFVEDGPESVGDGVGAGLGCVFLVFFVLVFLLLVLHLFCAFSYFSLFVLSFHLCFFRRCRVLFCLPTPLFICLSLRPRV